MNTWTRLAMAIFKLYRVARCVSEYSLPWTPPPLPSCVHKHLDGCMVDYRDSGIMGRGDIITTPRSSTTRWPEPRVSVSGLSVVLIYTRAYSCVSKGLGVAGVRNAPEALSF